MSLNWLALNNEKRPYNRSTTELLKMLKVLLFLLTFFSHKIILKIPFVLFYSFDERTIFLT